MKNFKFRFQSVLNAREKTLEERQLALAEVQNKLLKQRNHLEFLYQKLKEAKKSLENLLEKDQSMKVAQINDYQNYIVKLEEDIRNQHKLVADAEVEVDEKKKELAHALKEKTIMEKLKDKDYQQFKKDFEKREMQEIDEIATGKYKKK